MISPKTMEGFLRRFKCRLHRRDYPNNGNTGKRKNKESHVHGGKEIKFHFIGIWGLLSGKWND